MTSFIDKLEARVKNANSLVCVGLDPRANDAVAARDECLRLIAATSEYAATFKANSAFFEVFGAEGIAALKDVIAGVPREIPVILDAKRGDIADTSAAYAKAAFETLGASAMTVNPYQGSDAIAPYIAEAEHGAFILCKTSNAGADEFQALETDEGPLFEVVAQHAQVWNTRNNVGLVVGATDPKRIARVREPAPEMWILVPGIGAQGGDLEATLRMGLRADGTGLLINASRSIATAADPGAAAKTLRDQINALRELQMADGEWRMADSKSQMADGRWRMADSHSPSNKPGTDKLTQLADDLLASGCVRFGEFTLKSGKLSPIYLDLRRLVSYPAILKRVGQAYAALLRELNYDRIAGIPYAALPIATAAALELDQPLIYPRREVKEYGTKAAIEGEYRAGETVVVLDDLATTGDTKIETIEKLTSAGLKVRDIVVLIDRGQGATELLAQAGYTMYAVTTLPQLLTLWRETGAITAEQDERVRAFLAGA